MSPAPRLSVIVITKNEATRLRRCLGSVPFADEIIVVDSGSTDGTQAIAREMGAQLIETTDWPGFGPQKNRALDAARGTWVLSLDADEWLSEELAAQVRRAIEAPVSAQTPAGWGMNRLSAFCGQWMRHSGWYPDRIERLFQRGRARFSDDRVHERLRIDGPVGHLSGDVLHDSMPTLANSIDKLNRYSSGRALDLRLRGRRGGLGRAIGHGLWAFVRTYVLRRGFLDGRLGFVLAVHNAEASYYRYLKMWLDAADPARPAGPSA
ncbi:MAG: glycosyltransferase family 2 protein [Leptothrix sp. (in: b-proteobacteria)]